VVHYFVTGTTRTHRPFFGLHDFHNKSFMVSSLADNTEFISLEGAPEFFTFPPSSVSHTFKNLNLKLATPGYFPFNNAVFTNVTISKGSDHDEYHVVQRGMSIDFTSLASFHKNELLFPCTLYMRVIGGTELKQIFLQTTEAITLVGYIHGKKVQIPLDLSRLSHPITLSTQAPTEEEPLVVDWEIPDSLLRTVRPPEVRIDLSETPGDDVFVTFTGRAFTGSHHNLSEAITIDHGQHNIHIASAKDTKTGQYAGQPPHVRLEGVGDYYINGMKQVSAMSQGHHDDSVLEEDSIWPGILVPIVVCAAIIGGMTVFWYLPRAVPPPRVIRIDAAAPRDDGVHFPSVDPDDPKVEA
jgi:hypothetical protein